MVGVSIIIPTRNEEDNIDPLLQRLLGMAWPPNIGREILFVDDNSTDATRDRIRTWCRSEPIRLVCRDDGGSLAGAVIAGAREARHDLVMVMDADLSHPPEKIPELLQPLLDGTHDVVIGSRYVEGGEIPQWPMARKIASKLAGFPARLFTAVKDPMAGFFATDRQRLINARPDMPGFKIGFELLATAEDGIRVQEIPIVFSDRFEGFSKMNKQVIFDYLKQLLQLSGLIDKLCGPLLLGLFAVLGTLGNWLLFTVLLRYGSSPIAAHLTALAGSSLALVVVLALRRRRSAGDFSLTGLRLFSWVVALVCALSIQGGVFAATQALLPVPPQLAFLPAAAAGTLCFLLPTIIILFSGFGRLAVRVRLRFGAIGAILAVVLIRLVYLGLPELMEQEAYYWNYAQHPALSYLDHPPLVALLIWFGTGLFGTTEFGVRLGAFACWFVSAFFVHRLTGRICGRTAALGAVLLLAVLPFFFGIGLLMTPDAPLHAAWAALLYFLYRALVDGRSKAWLGAGISLGLGLLSQYTIALLGPAALGFMLVDRRARSWFVRGEPFGALLLALLLFLPVLVWNYQHEWVSLLFDDRERLTDRAVFSTYHLLGYIAVNLTPAGLLGLYFFLVKGNSLSVSQCSSESGGDERERWRRHLFLLFMVMVPLLVFLFSSFTREAKPNWTSPLWLAALPFFGAGAMGLFGPGRPALLFRWLHRWWQWTVAVLLLVYVVVLHYAVLGLPGLPHPARPFLVGWQEFARQIETIVEEVESETGSRPIVVGMDPYQISSGLAFYRAKNDGENRARVVEETAGWHLFTWDGLMYEYWTDPDDMVGRDILVIASSRIRVEYPYYQNRMTSMSAVQELAVTKDEQTVRTMYYRLVYGYRLAKQ